MNTLFLCIAGGIDMAFMQGPYADIIAESTQCPPGLEQKDMSPALKQPKFQEAGGRQEICLYHRYCAQFLTALIRLCD